MLVGCLDAKEAPGHQIWVADSEIQKLISLLDPFQEWPQLLDPLLPDLVKPLVSAFLRVLVAGQHVDQSQIRGPRSGLSPLLCGICCILNTLCKVRGAKIITAFLNNEPKYLEPMLRAMLRGQSSLTWQERYIMLLWLSHLVLNPFDLQSISSSNDSLLTQAPFPGGLRHLSLPVIATALISAGLQNLTVAGKERESARRLVVRMALRPDMQRLGLHHDLVNFVFTELDDYTQNPAASTYECMGYLSILAGIVKSGSADDVLPFLTSIFNFSLKAATAESTASSIIRASAPARKMLVVILRTSTLHAISLNSKCGLKAISDENIYGMLEALIQYLLDALGDKDTPVRLAASKAFSIVAERLAEEMRIEVVQAVLDTLEEDILYEQPDSGKPIPVRLLTNGSRQSMSRNMTAVNPIKWQGLLFTLGHLLFKRTAPPGQLAPILKSLLSGLDFEQRSSGGISIGGSVRDAACFGLWSLARKYATFDLQSVDCTSVLPALEATFSLPNDTSILQIIADQLVVSACLDPSGNIRRGSSAALQELIGRHPNTIIDGIAIVQVVDYHAVARRSRAMLDVARGTAELAQVYRWALLNALLGWRGVRAADDDSRRTAATAISNLVSHGHPLDFFTVLDSAQAKLNRLPLENSKIVADSRHGLLLTISRLLDTMDPVRIAPPDSTAGSPIASLFHPLWEGIRMDGHILGSLKGRFVSELVLEGAASLVSSLVHGDPGGLYKSSERVIEVLDVCLTRADHEPVLVACADAAQTLFSSLSEPQKVDLLGRWLDPQRRGHPSFSCKGRILAFGAVYGTLPEDMIVSPASREDNCKSRVFAQLMNFIQGKWPIETQITALRSLAFTISHLGDENIEEALCASLDNYANDQRGDIGSLARLEAVKAVSALLPKLAQGSNPISDNHKLQPVVQRLFRLAGEKLDKLRFEAWKCIEGFLTKTDIHSAPSFSHVVDVSSYQYYSALLEFLQVPCLQSCIMQGIVQSVTSGTEDLMRLSRLALVRTVSGSFPGMGVAEVLDTLVTLLEDTCTDDRQATPILETIAFILEQHVGEERGSGSKIPARKLWNIVRKAHFKSTNIRKLEAAVKIYEALAVQGDMRRNALTKLRDLLLHPYPTIRNAAADALYIEMPNELLLNHDWSRPQKEHKEVILKLNHAEPELRDTN